MAFKMKGFSGPFKQITDKRVFDVNQERYDKWNRLKNRGKGPDVRHLGAKENKSHLDKYIKWKKAGGKFIADDGTPMKQRNTIDRRHAKRINIENISAVQNKGGKNFVVEVGDNEWYDPSKSDFIGSSSDPENMVLGKHMGKKDAIGPLDRTWRGNYNDWNNKRDTILVNPSYKVGDLIDETEWETGEATKRAKKSPMKKGSAVIVDKKKKKKKRKSKGGKDTPPPPAPDMHGPDNVQHNSMLLQREKNGKGSPMKLSIELGDSFTGGGASHAKRMRSDAKYRQGQSRKASKAKDKHAKRVERRG